MSGKTVMVGCGWVWKAQFLADGLAWNFPMVDLARRFLYEAQYIQVEAQLLGASQVGFFITRNYRFDERAALSKAKGGTK